MPIIPYCAIFIRVYKITKKPQCSGRKINSAIGKHIKKNIVEGTRSRLKYCAFIIMARSLLSYLKT